MGILEPATTTLNSKCYETIVSSFTELITEIATGKLSLIKQDLRERSYFSGSKKPSPGCILNWHNSAENIDATIRALDFDRYENSLSLPKSVIAGEIIIVDRVPARFEIERSNSISVLVWHWHRSIED